MDTLIQQRSKVHWNTWFRWMELCTKTSCNSVTNFILAAECCAMGRSSQSVTWSLSWKLPWCWVHTHDYVVSLACPEALADFFTIPQNSSRGQCRICQYIHKVKKDPMFPRDTTWTNAAEINSNRQQLLVTTSWRCSRGILNYLRTKHCAARHTWRVGREDGWVHWWLLLMIASEQGVF